LDFEADESYTPTRIVFLAGSGGNDLVEWGEMRLEQPRGWIWADFSGVGDVDDDDEDDDEDIETPEEAEGILGQQPSRLTTNPSDATTITQDPNPDLMNLDPPQPQIATPAQTQAHAQAAVPTPGTAQTQPSASSPTVHLSRSQPRRPLQHITPSRTNAAQSPRKKPRTPILCAHLVQIKILENHQNGKDTHLRGLQIFALDNEGARPTRPAEVRTPGGKAMGRMSTGARESGSGKRKGGLAGRFGGLGLGSGKWDVEPTIR
jgi:anaphase-promoting complex subunit 10